MKLLLCKDQLKMAKTDLNTIMIISSIIRSMIGSDFAVDSQKFISIYWEIQHFHFEILYSKCFPNY